MYIYQIVVSCTKHFHINPSDIIVLTMRWRVDGRKRRSFPVSFFIEYCIQFHEKIENSLFFEQIKRNRKIFEVSFFDPWKDILWSFRFI